MKTQTTSLMLAAAAIAGLLTGCATPKKEECHNCPATKTQKGKADCSAKHSCQGKNGCSAKGSCGANGCNAKHSCHAKKKS